MEQEAFGNVRSQLGACGIWCGSCAVGNGSLRAASKELLRVLELHGFDHWAAAELDFEKLRDGLVGVGRLAECPGCRQGGGRSGCEMRDCSGQQRIEGCTACGQSACPHTESLEAMRSGARRAGLIVNSRRGDAHQPVADWTEKLRGQFPSCLLFLPCREDAETL